jgi:hypothetical protein
MDDIEVVATDGPKRLIEAGHLVTGQFFQLFRMERSLNLLGGRLVGFQLSFAAELRRQHRIRDAVAEGENDPHDWIEKAVGGPRYMPHQGTSPKCKHGVSLDEKTGRCDDTPGRSHLASPVVKRVADGLADFAGGEPHVLTISGHDGEVAAAVMALQ